jgi:hypothetical protein
LTFQSSIVNAIQFTYDRMTAFDTTPDTDSPIGGPRRLAAFLCLLGFSMLIILPQPLLNSLGLLSSDTAGGNPMKKIHPGSMVIILSFSTKKPATISRQAESSHGSNRPSASLSSLSIAITALRILICTNNPLMPINI